MKVIGEEVKRLAVKRKSLRKRTIDPDRFNVTGNTFLRELKEKNMAKEKVEKKERRRKHSMS